MVREMYSESKNLSYFLDGHTSSRDLSPCGGAVFLRVRFEPTIPKLLVKVSFKDCGRDLSVPNLGEVLLRSNGKERIAVINLSSHVEAGEIVMSLKLAEMLKVIEGHMVEVTPAPGAAKEKPRVSKPSTTWDSYVGRQSMPGPTKTQEATRLRTMLSEALSGDSGKYAGGTSARGIPSASPRDTPPEYSSRSEFHPRNLGTNGMPNPRSSARVSSDSYESRGHADAYAQAKPRANATYSTSRGVSPTYLDRYNQTRSYSRGSSSTPWPGNQFPARPTAPSRYSTRYETSAPNSARQEGSRYSSLGTQSRFFVAPGSRKSSGSAGTNTPFQTYSSSKGSRDSKSYDQYTKNAFGRRTGKSSTTTPDSLPSSPEENDDDAGKIPWQQAFADALRRDISDLSPSGSSDDSPVLRPRAPPFAEGAYSAYCRSEPQRQSAPGVPYDYSRYSATNSSSYDEAAFAARLRELSARARFSQPPDTDDRHRTSPKLYHAAEYAEGIRKALLRRMGAGSEETTSEERDSPGATGCNTRSFLNKTYHNESASDASEGCCAESDATSSTTSRGLTHGEDPFPSCDQDREGRTSFTLQCSSPSLATCERVSSAIVPFLGVVDSDRKSGKKPRRSKEVLLGSVQVDAVELSPIAKRSKLPRTVRPPRRLSNDLYSDGLEASDMGSDVADSMRQWLDGKISGRHVAHLISDRCHASAANFRSGFGQNIIGGPLGAVVGGQIEGRTLYNDIFRHTPEMAIQDAFQHFGFAAREGSSALGKNDWSHVSFDEVSLAYRRSSLKNHPNRGGSMLKFIKTQASMEILRAFTIRVSTTRPSVCADDVDIAKELARSIEEVEQDAKNMSREELRRCNKVFDDYILRQMRFKSEVIDEMARLHENAAYAILGVDALASDDEIKKAYRQIAMACHPDKGGDKEEFQELTNAYEKIMGQRREPRKSDDDCPGTPTAPKPPSPKQDTRGEEEPQKEKAEKEKKEKKKKEDSQSEDAEEVDTDESEAESDSDAGERFKTDEAASPNEVLDKVSKAAEEASRFANTAADFAHQVTEASKTARKAADTEVLTNHNGECRLTRTIAHSAIVLTLTVVKAVRVVGYAALDAAAHALHASKKLATTPECAAAAASAMSSGFEALNAASTCAQATESAASELQAAINDNIHLDPIRLADAAGQAALAAASAAHAAIAAAISASEASKETAKVVYEWTEKNEKEKAEKEEKKEKRRKSKDKKSEEGKDKDSSEEKHSSGSTTPEEPKEDEASEETEQERAKKDEDRFLAQRVSNHKLLQRLNAEILGYQSNVRHFLVQNSLLIPEVSKEQKADVFAVLADYIADAKTIMQNSYSSGQSCEEIFSTLLSKPPLATYMLATPLAISISVESRVLKTAQVLDCKMLWNAISSGIFDFLERLFPDIPPRIGRIKNKIKDDIFSMVSDPEKRDK